MRIFPLVLFLFGLQGAAAQSMPTPTGEGGLMFIENKGQWPDQVRFMAKTKAGDLWFEDQGITFHLFHPGDFEAILGHTDEQLAHAHHHHGDDSIIRMHAYRVHFLNANPKPRLSGIDTTVGHRNYFIGNDPRKWASAVLAFKEITYHEVWPGVDLHFYQSGAHLKYDVRLAAGANPDDIAFRYDDVDELQLIRNQLVVSTSVNTITESEPITWQVDHAQRFPVRSGYRVEGNTVRFQVAKEYDPTLPLVIDPVLTFSSTTGATADNWGFSATYDSAGALYGAGIAFGAGYPRTNGAYQTVWGGGASGNQNAGCDVAITKFAPDGKTLEYSTFLGGAANEIPHSLIVNTVGELYVMGTTGSFNFPTAANGFDLGFSGGTSETVANILFPNGSDLFVSRFSADGKSLLSGTYLGGSSNDGLNTATQLNRNYADHARGEIDLDAAGNVYVASCTRSTNFPVSFTAFQNSPQGSQDGVLVKLLPDLSGLFFSSYVGGNQADAVYGIEIADNGDIYVCGGTLSTNLPAGGWQAGAPGGSADGFVLAINNAGTLALSGTYVGTGQYDQAYLIEIDDDGDVYTMGQSEGSFPVTPGTYNNPGSSHFIVKFNPSLNNRLMSTVFGNGSGVAALSPTAFLVDKCKSIYVSGWGGSTNGNGLITGFPITNDAFQSVTDGSDIYFIVLNKNAERLVYGSYFGGLLSSEHVDGGTSRFDDRGAIYQAVCSGCGGNDDFPTTVGAWSTTNPSSNCNLGVIKFEFQFTESVANATANPRDTGCIPFTVNFESDGSRGFNFLWDFGDGNTSTELNPTHTYWDTGSFVVTFIASDTVLCFTSDTMQLVIRVDLPSNIFADGDVTPTEGCVPVEIAYANLSSPGSPFVWQFGDGTSSFDSSGTHTYVTPNEYMIQLIVIDTTKCLQHDTAVFPVNVSPFAIADFTWDPEYINPGDEVRLVNLSQNSTSWHWTWPGGESFAYEPSIYFDAVGVYEVCLVAMNDLGCNDTICKTIRVEPPPVIDVPTAFTPDGDKFNDILYVRGRGVQEMHFRVFNRWGQMVFESQNLNDGWDGRFKGKLQEMDVFVFTLAGNFLTGESFFKKGNITLLP